MENLTQYQNEINELVALAKRINYNMENGIEELFQIWINEGRKFQEFVQDNKKEFIIVTKQFI
jgi:hypothetical protein